MFDFANIRQTIVSLAGALLFSTVIVGAAVLPAQQAVAAALHL